ncbi:hypothetical protein LUZ60_013755 [Juncus effusus]|nr:hypothetical protein LUZ60_013755 [Juncus effusus]
MALAFIGESVAEGIIDNLVGTAYSFIEENLLPAGIDMEEELERLQDTLPQIKMVLSAVENDEIKNENKALNSWLWRFRDAIDSAEDVLDEMAYYELEEKVKDRDDKVGGSMSNLKRKFGKYVNRKFNNETLTRLVKVVKGLDRIAASACNFLDLEKQSSRFRSKNYEEKVENDRETGSMLTESVVFGREKERGTIVEWLITDWRKLSTFTIYGIGGLGKTTLAQLIYKDERVRHFFDVIIWVCVSDQFDAVTVTAKILEVMTKESPSVRSLTALQDVLKENLISKKFLLVLDDVWNDENRSEWEKLIAPLKYGHGKSKILVTTRMESVADMAAKVIEGKNDRLKLEGLEDNEFMKLFNMHAFDGVESNEYKNLHPIGKQIAKKLGGCPLAAKVMGGVLNYCIEFEYWNKVLKEDVPNFQVGKNGIMVVLRLSYNHLPTYLQLCFRYCSIFPKDYQFSKDKLIWMWMSSGLIEPVNVRQKPEDVGGEYFNHLVRKSFFDLKVEEFAGRFSQHYYVMHDLLHDLAQAVSDGECLQVEESSLRIPKTIRHLNFKMESLLATREISHLKNLHTLCITYEGQSPDSDDIRIFGVVLKGLKSLRLLSLTLKNLCKVPDTIGELIHLRYLSLESNAAGFQELSWFPQSVYNLYHLEVIKFSASFVKDIEEHEKNGIVNLIKLRHLDITFEILNQFPSIGMLTYLQELKVFFIREENGYRISELKDLRSIRQLDIQDLDNVKDPTEAKEAKLDEKEYLKDLSLYWSFNRSGSPEEYEQVIENLRPHIHLEKLRISNYGGRRPPHWMTHFFLVNMISLDLSRCFMLVSLPTLGKLPMLERLILRDIPQVKQIDSAFYGNGTECAFPQLKELTLSELQGLEEWAEIQGMILFPQLEFLYISDSLNLRRLPCLPPSLSHLDISSLGLEVLPSIYNANNNNLVSSKSKLSYLGVTDCPNLTSLNGCLLQQQEYMRALSRFDIHNCPELMHLPSRGFSDFISLRNVSVEGCPKLVATSHAQENLLPFSLENLNIGVCDLDVPLLWSIQNLTALTKLSLSGCPNVQSLPSLEVLATLTSLYDLWISCPELISLSGLEVLMSLRRLQITECDKLITISRSQPPLSSNPDNCSLQLDKLHIQHSSLILLEPLRNLRLTKELVIGDASILTSLPEEWLLQNRNTLQSLTIFSAVNIVCLPSCMERLRFLENLQINNAQLVESLPDLPLSLTSLVLYGCHPALMERYNKDNGPEWYRIAFIPTVIID